MNITCVIVDDEKLARDLLQEYTQQMPNLQVLGEASKGKDAVELIDKLKPDLVFLDVQMPGMTGFDVVDEITHDPHVIFCTAYDQYAIKAFEKGAVDYILKPLDQE
ncbi:MAG TPA: response regulator, partial [Chryseolinea sp.]|nr:response regulator [Chryseolinea sp.]